MSKVKGHATEAQVEEGTVAAEDKEGNDWADEFANKGARQHEPHALKLARWLQQRHNCYRKFMGRVQSCIAVVLKAEQKEREKKKLQQAMIEGYDAEKVMVATCLLPAHEDSGLANSLSMIPATRGVHRMSVRQHYYEAVHAFMKARRWQPVDPQAKVAGTTWLELFVLFDSLGYRTYRDKVAQDDVALKRACKRSMKRVKTNRSSVARASLRKEIAIFKAAVRYVARNDMAPHQQEFFLSEPRQELRRLAPFAIIGHQPGINVWCVMGQVEKERVEEAICAQRTAATRKMQLSIAEAKKHALNTGAMPAIKLKRVKIDMAGCIKWSRSEKGDATGACQHDDARNGNSEQLRMQNRPRYASRLLTCPACGMQKETASMQLRTVFGYRDIH